MSPTHQFITDTNGHKVAVIVPIGEYDAWMLAQREYQRLRVLNDLVEGMRYIDDARAGRKPKKLATDLLAEL